MKIYVTRKSSNRKVGPIPVTTTSAVTCPDACPLKNAGCYADGGPLAILWRKVTAGTAGLEWKDFIKAVQAFKPGQLWRHNQAGDLPGHGDHLDPIKCSQLAFANTDRCGFTYTHYPVEKGNNERIIRAMNRKGFTVNVSLNSLTEVDRYTNNPKYKGLPLTTVLPVEYENEKFAYTPKGNRVIVCPAVNGTAKNCVECGLCAKANRKLPIGFPAHGNRKAQINAA